MHTIINLGVPPPTGPAAIATVATTLPPPSTYYTQPPPPQQPAAPLPPYPIPGVPYPIHSPAAPAYPHTTAALTKYEVDYRTSPAPAAAAPGYGDANAGYYTRQLQPPPGHPQKQEEEDFRRFAKTWLEERYRGILEIKLFLY
jgi:hypothetical protein